MFSIRKYLQDDELLSHFHHSSNLNKQRYFHADLQGEVYRAHWTRHIYPLPSQPRNNNDVAASGGRAEPLKKSRIALLLYSF